jgi:predicted nucleotidyltransferase
MPVRSLHSPVLKWPDREAVFTAARQWALALCSRDVRVARVGCFGSYARGDAGVGSDLDFVVIVRAGERDCQFDVSRLPVPADVVVFDEPNRVRLSGERTGIARTIAREAVWLA